MGFAALLGWTNVGKSSLLNRFVGEKVAAVSDAPQTTRNRIVGIRSVVDRGQIAFVDTPGLHQPRHRMNRAMVRQAQDSLAAVDIALLVVDAARGLGAGDARAAHVLREAGRVGIAVLNKIDLVRTKDRLLPMMDTVVTEWGMTAALPVSAWTGEGCEHLLATVIDLLPEGAPLFPDDQYTDQPEKALAAEWIREKVLLHTRQEIPHAVAVSVDDWTEREDGLISIAATIVVERDSQKSIVIGRGGQLLKRVGTEARRDLEALLDTRVFLELWVKVRSGWRDDERALRELGLA
jgi:GTP-binding protein Era